jgi:hypothetical protein
MVTFDPCERLKTIEKQLIPAILTSARENTSSDIKTAIELNLPVLEEKCYKLVENVKENGLDAIKRLNYATGTI